MQIENVLIITDICDRHHRPDQKHHIPSPRIFSWALTGKSMHGGPTREQLPPSHLSSMQPAHQLHREAKIVAELAAQLRVKDVQVAEWPASSTGMSNTSKCSIFPTELVQNRPGRPPRSAGTQNGK